MLAINTVPDQVQVRIEGEGQVFTGDAPNEFRVPRGRYRVTVSKPNFVRQERDITIDVAETKPLFFKLDPIPARLEIRTVPATPPSMCEATARRTPTHRIVEPGDYEIYAEANDHIARRDVVSLAPGQQLKLDFPLAYVQRSGRPELIGFWIGIGAIGGGMAVTTRLSPGQPGNLILIGCRRSGGRHRRGRDLGGPGSWLHQGQPGPVPHRRGLDWRCGRAVPGTGAHAERLRRVAGRRGGPRRRLGGGMVAGRPRTQLRSRGHDPKWSVLGCAGRGAGNPGHGIRFGIHHHYHHHRQTAPQRRGYADRVGWGMLAGINAGLATGLALAYLPDQRAYGPSWQRVMLIDLAAVAGGFTGALIQMCVSGQGNKGVCGNAEIGPKWPATPLPEAQSAWRPACS